MMKSCALPFSPSVERKLRGLKRRAEFWQNVFDKLLQPLTAGRFHTIAFWLKSLKLWQRSRPKPVCAAVNRDWWTFTVRGGSDNSMRIAERTQRGRQVMQISAAGRTLVQSCQNATVYYCPFQRCNISASVSRMLVFTTASQTSWLSWHWKAINHVLLIK